MTISRTTLPDQQTANTVVSCIMEAAPLKHTLKDGLLGSIEENVTLGHVASGRHAIPLRAELKSKAESLVSAASCLITAPGTPIDAGIAVVTAPANTFSQFLSVPPPPTRFVGHHYQQQSPLLTGLNWYDPGGMLLAGTGAATQPLVFPVSQAKTAVSAEETESCSEVHGGIRERPSPTAATGLCVRYVGDDQKGIGSTGGCGGDFEIPVGFDSGGNNADGYYGAGLQVFDGRAGLLPMGLLPTNGAPAIDGNVAGATWMLPYVPVLQVPFFEANMFAGGLVNFSLGPSADLNGADLPLNDLTSLRYFFNLGIEYVRQLSGAFQLQLAPSATLMPLSVSDGSAATAAAAMPPVIPVGVPPPSSLASVVSASPVIIMGPQPTEFSSTGIDLSSGMSIGPIATVTSPVYSWPLTAPPGGDTIGDTFGRHLGASVDCYYRRYCGIQVHNEESSYGTVVDGLGQDRSASFGQQHAILHGTIPPFQPSTTAPMPQITPTTTPVTHTATVGLAGSANTGDR
jgi:hypothetical protein